MIAIQTVLTRTSSHQKQYTPTPKQARFPLTVKAVYFFNTLKNIDKLAHLLDSLHSFTVVSKFYVPVMECL